MRIQRLKDGRLRDSKTGRILKDASPEQDVKELNSFLNALFPVIQKAGKYKIARKYYDKLQKVYQPAKAERDKLIGK